MSQQNLDNRAGIRLMVVTCLIFAIQDAISRHLAGTYNAYMVVMIRYWFFGLFVLALAARHPGGIRQALKTAHPLLQPFRGVLLGVEIVVLVSCLVLLGMIETVVIFAGAPLIVAALSGPVLGERLGWRRWLAICVGFIGILIILRPGAGMFTPAALLALLGTAMFALYVLLTSYVGRQDSSMVSFYWTGLGGAVVLTIIGLFHLQPMHGFDWLWMGLLCCTGALGHFMMIRVYEIAEASAVQPFAYFHMVFAVLAGMIVFGESLTLHAAVGAVIVVGAGLFSLYRQRVRAKEAG